MPPTRRRLAFVLVSALMLAAPLPSRGGEGSPDAAPEDEKEPPQGVTTTLTQTLHGESGVAIQTMCTNCNSADLSLGGLGNEHVSMVCDGVPVPPGLAQVYLLSICPPTVIDNVAVEKGASSARFDGGAVGGEIEIRRRRPQPGVDLSVSADTGSYGWAATRADLSGQVGWLGGNLLASWAQSDRIDANSDGRADDPAFDRLTVEARTDIRLGRNQSLRVNYGSYQEDQEGGPAAYYLSFSDPSDEGWNLENVELERAQADAVYEIRFRGGSTVTLGALWADRGADIEETLLEFAPFIEGFIPTYFIDETHRHASLGWSLPLGNRTVLRSGAAWTEREFSVVDVRYNAFVLGLPFDGEALTRADDETVTETGAWVEGEIDLTRGLSLQVGVRYVDFSYDENVVYGTNEFIQDAWEAFPLPEGNRTLPRAALTWKPMDTLTLRFSAGTGFRQPSPTYEEVCCGRRYRTNRDIRMERSSAVGVEVTYQPVPRYQVRGSVFRTDLDDMIVQMATSADPYFAPTYQNANIPEASVTNYEVAATAEVNRWLDVKGSVHRCQGYNRSPNDTFTVLISDFNQPTTVSFTTPDIPYLAERGGTVGLAAHTPDRKWTGNLDAQYTGPRVIQEWPEANPFLTEYDLRFVSAESFWVVNARLSRELPQGIAVYVGVDNLNDYVQNDLDDRARDYTWGPLRGRYVYGGLSYRFNRVGR